MCCRLLRTRIQLRLMIFAGCLIFGLVTPSLAQNFPTELLSTSVIENRINEARTSAMLLEPEKTEIIELLQRALAHSKAAATLLTKRDEYAHSLIDAPVQLANLRTQANKVVKPQMRSLVLRWRFSSAEPVKPHKLSRS